MDKARGRSVKLNFVTGLAHELIVIVFGLVLPRITLSYFGSTYNGLLNSVAQFMSFSVVLRSGLGAVTNAALYKPLAEGSMEQISGIMVATDRFMRKIGWLLALIILGFALLYPFLVLDEFGYVFSFTLILIMGAASWVENMFSIKYKILLQADQKYYVQTLVTVIAYILSNVFSVVLIVCGFGIHIVRLGTLLGLATTPFMLKIYVDRHYDINWKQAENTVAIKSRWDAFAQQIATIANNNVSTILMTFLFPLKEISVYTIYYMVVKNINQLMTSSFAGIRSTFGNMYAKGENNHLRKRFDEVEWIIFAGGAVLYTVTGILLTPFVLIYTRGISDADYNRYWFGLLMTLSCYVYTTRLPYQLMTEAAGCFKETRNSAIAEVVCNIVVSLICVPFIGLNGILVGALFGGVIRVSNLIWVCNRKILKKPLWSVIKNYSLYLGVSSVMTILISRGGRTQCASFIEWIFIAIPVMLVVSIAIISISLICYRKQFIGILKYMLKKK